MSEYDDISHTKLVIVCESWSLLFALTSMLSLLQNAQNVTFSLASINCILIKNERNTSKSLGVVC